MLGAVIGDIIGSVHEYEGTKTKEFPLFTVASCFTDDTVLTVAVADVLLRGGDYVDTFHDYVSAYPDAGYGSHFLKWALSRNREPYFSFGNGSAMRVSPVAYVFETLDDVLEEAGRCAAVTHNHPEGIKGAEATATAVFLARTGKTKQEIRTLIESRFGYDLSQNLDDIRETYTYDVTCQGSVPQSIIAFLQSENFEDAIRNAVSLGGDADTMACIAGAIAEPFYGGAPEAITVEATRRIDTHFRRVIEAFRGRLS